MGMNLDDILQSHRTRRAVVAGILNVTPDSFSDGGKFLSPQAAVEQARRMVAGGADIIDIGAESTRPGSQRVSPREQIERLREVLPALRECGAEQSIDTTSADVAAFAIAAGTTIINDVSAGREDPEMFGLAARSGAAIILMHMRGEPRTMQKDVHYDDVVGEVRQFLEDRAEAAVSAGVQRERIIMDAGIGFGKLKEHNLELLRRMDEIVAIGQPVMVGPSRKRFIGEITARRTGETPAPQDQPDRRLGGTIGACLAAWKCGATIFRVHDVAEVTAALKVAAAIEKQETT